MDPTLLALQDAVAGRFSLERELGRGGMGIVYLARDLSLERAVAIKLLEPGLAGMPAMRERFLREVRAAARLSHPHIVPIHSVEDQGDLVFFVMGYVVGETLGQRVRRVGPLSRTEALRLAQEVGWALGHAHATGIVHRDIKPDNILIERGSGRALVADFGIAGLLEQGGTTSAERTGTPAYMSPEQIAGEPVDGRSDLYALGATLHFALTGERLFDGEADSMMLQHLHAEPPSLVEARPDLPARFGAAIERCLAKRPDDRFATAEEFVEAVASARSALAETPAPVAVWVRDADAAGREIGPALIAAGVALGVQGAVFGADSLTGVVFLPIAALMGGLGLVRFGDLVMRTRQLRLLGYDHASVAPGLAAERRLADHAALTQPANPAGFLDQTRVILAAGALKTGLFLLMVQSDVNWVWMVGAAGTILMPTATLRQLWGRWGKARGWWSRLLEGRFGRWIFRLATIGQQKDAVPLPADAPTEVLLGDAAERLFQALPAARRDELGDVAALLQRLRSTAERSHGQTARRSEALAALESIRLHLLRLQVENGAGEDLTRAIREVQAVAAAVDRALGRGTPPT